MITTNPLSVELLEGAAYLCLAKAARTDMDLLISGAERMIRENHHARRRRFMEAQARMEKNPGTPLSALGITSQDCGWAILFADKAKDSSAWRRAFTSAQEILVQEKESAKSAPP